MMREMSLTMSSLVITSLAISIIAAFVMFDICRRAYRRFRSCPDEESLWFFIASFTLFLAFATLFVAALGGATIQSGASDDVVELVAHIAMIGRGALLFLAIALWYGYRKIPKLNGGPPRGV